MPERDVPQNELRAINSVGRMASLRLRRGRREWSRARGEPEASKHRWPSPDDFHKAAGHPAPLVSTRSLLHMDVRQLSNSMRTMASDSSTQLMLPAGDSNSMVLVGLGDQLTSLVDMLKIMDAEAAIEDAGRRSTTAVVPLANATAGELTPTLLKATGIGPEVSAADSRRILSDACTNSVILVGPKGWVVSARALIALLDTATAKR